MSRIEEKLNVLKNTKSDINEHLQTLKSLAKSVNTITEFGVRDVVSTYAFLAANPKKLTSYDIHKSNNIYEAIGMAVESNIDFKFIEADVLKIEIEKTDLLFIDTLHIYSQLKAELALHAKNVNKFIVLHDTVTYGSVDEPTSWQTPAIMENYKKDSKTGIFPALEEFIDQNKNWKICAHFPNNNGLTVIEKIA